ncbi:hypothetical protein INS49_000445 [Diaporthe citri]|uniref:uncharacterized protein n=1 Tax=Diaporthe citri TaxID=83186 RepID=UPI001C80EF8D|nr:uncharacterized protein INS49_000445 [Diaporthe citri]KAG6366269.1 hypothetical protein INS49_000445 [Diaporthe citri]
MASTEIHSLPVQELYSKWSTSYDQERANNLRGLDDTGLETLLPKFTSLLVQSHGSSTGPLRVVDFGCGTGRNTLKLMAMLPGAEIIGLDATPAMLEVAERRCNQASSELPANLLPGSLSFKVYNPLEKKMGVGTPVPGQAQGLISTLVIEHLPIAEFFKMCSEFVGPGGYVLATNAHEDLARIARASIVDPETGALLWGESHTHTNEAVKKEGAKWGFDLVEIQEGIPKDPNIVGPMRGHWDGVKCWVGFVLRRQN